MDIYRSPRPGALALRVPLIMALATLAAACNLVIDGDDGDAGLRARIERTSHGVPHVTADDPASLGWGVGYAQAADGVCGLAQQFTVVAGQSARHFGAGDPDAGAGGLPAHVASDFFFRLLNDDATVATAMAAQSATSRALIRGWVQGYNRWLSDAGGQLPEACRGQPWVREARDEDLVRLLRFYATLNDIGALQGMVVSAEPPVPGQTGRRQLPGPPRPRPTASNAIALGKDGSDNGRGLLLGNPHFPWQAPLRMMQLHARIPGQLDAMGATLPGIPLVAIGFTNSFAWSHTTNTSAHGTAYQLQLDPADPTRYIVDGTSQPMQRHYLTVQVLQPDGTLRDQTRSLFSTGFGWLIGWESGATALTYRSANLDNHRMLDEWWGINRSSTLAEVKAHVQRNVGNPWNNLLAADKDGRTMMLTVSPVPRLSAPALEQCQVGGYEAWAAAGVHVLAARGACAWTSDPAAPQPGIFAGAELPAIERADFVHNANDSAWLANPAQPQAGYSPLVSRDNLPLDARPRHGLEQVAASLAGGQRMSAARLQQLVMGNRAHTADLLLDDLLGACAGVPELAHACAAMAAWDRTANLDVGIGYGYFEAFVRTEGPLPDDAWRVPFDPAQPVATPRGLRVDEPAVREAVLGALAQAVAEVDGMGLWRGGRRWGDIQGATRGDTRVPIHGGSDLLGVYNAIESVWLPGSLQREVVAGTSWLQVVSFEPDGPKAQALLSYSQQQDPQGADSADQTWLFSDKHWWTLPFSAEAIAADPAYRRFDLR